MTHSVTPVDKEKFKAGGKSYIDAHDPTLSNPSTGTYIAKNAVKAGDKTYDLKIVTGNNNIKSALWSSENTLMAVYGDGAKEYTLYVVDSSGNPVSWTGYWGLDHLDNGREYARLNTSYASEFYNDGTSHKTISETGYNVMYSSSGTGKFVCFKSTIPTSGIKMKLSASGGGGYVIIGIINKRLNAMSLPESASKWESI